MQELIEIINRNEDLLAILPLAVALSLYAVARIYFWAAPSDTEEV